MFEVYVKCDREWEGRRRRRGGPAWVWGSDVFLGQLGSDGG